MDPKANIYRLTQKNKQYIATISLNENSIKLSCKNELEHTIQFSREFTLENLKKLEPIFDIIKTPIEAIEWIDKAMKFQNVRIDDENSTFKIIFHIITKGISNQIEIPLTKEGAISANINSEINSEIITGTGSNFIQETKTTTKTLTNIDFIREIGLDPSQIVKQSINEDTELIIKSIKDEQRKSLSNIKYELNDVINNDLTLTEENKDINTEANIENNIIQESNYKIQEETKNINLQTNIEEAPKYEEPNNDYNQFTNNDIQEIAAQYTEAIPELKTQSNIQNINLNIEDNQVQYNFEDFQASSTQEIAYQNIEANKTENTFESNQIPLENTQSTFMQKPFIAPADENIGQIEQTETNFQNQVEEVSPTNYEEYQAKNQEQEFNAQQFVNTEFETTQTQNVQDYGNEQVGGEVNFTTEMNTVNNQLNELQNLNSKVDELIGLKSQFEEINNLKEEIYKMNLFGSSNEQYANLSEKMEGNQENEKEILKAKIQELEKLISQYQQEILNLKGNNAIIKECSEKEKEEHLIGQKIHQITVKGEIIHNSEELELIVKKINKINNKITLNLLYKATADSDKASVFHEKCDGAKSSLVLIETDKGKRFGGFTTSSWSGDCIDKKDEDSFIFSLNKMKIYENIPGELAIGCYPNYGPIFLGCQIRIYDNAFTKGGTTFEKGLNFNTQEDYELTDGERTFNVKEIEVYEAIIQ